MRSSSFRHGPPLHRLLIGLVAVGVAGIGCVDLTPPWQSSRAGDGSVGAAGGLGGQPDGSGGTGGPASDPDAQGQGGTTSVDAPVLGSGGSGSTDDAGGPREEVDAPGTPSSADGSAGSDGARAETGDSVDASDGRSDPLGGAGGRDAGAASTGGATGTGGAGGVSGSGGSGGGGAGGGAGAVDGGHCDAGGVLDSGICWYLGELGANCSTTCSPHGGTSPETPSHVGTASQNGSPRECSRLLGLLGQVGVVQTDALAGLSQGLGCHVYPAQTPPNRWLSSPAYNDAASDPDAQILCGCLQ